MLNTSGTVALRPIDDSFIQAGKVEENSVERQKLMNESEPRTSKMRDWIIIIVGLSLGLVALGTVFYLDCLPRGNPYSE